MAGFGLILIYSVLATSSLIKSTDAACFNGDLCLNNGICQFTDGREKCTCQHGFYGVICSEYWSSFKIGMKEGKVLPTKTQLEQHFAKENLILISVTPSAGKAILTFESQVESQQQIESTFRKYDELKVFSDNMVTIEDLDECKDDQFVCTKNTRCKNTVGSFSCQCNQGYEKVNNVCKLTASSVWKADGVLVWIIIFGSILVILIIMITVFHALKWRKNRRLRKGSVAEVIETESETKAQSVSGKSNTIQVVNSKVNLVASNKYQRSKSVDDKYSALSDPTYYKYSRKYRQRTRFNNPKLNRSKSMSTYASNPRTFQSYIPQDSVDGYTMNMQPAFYPQSTFYPQPGSPYVIPNDYATQQAPYMFNYPDTVLQQGTPGIQQGNIGLQQGNIGLQQGQYDQGVSADHGVNYAYDVDHLNYNYGVGQSYDNTNTVPSNFYLSSDGDV